MLGLGPVHRQLLSGNLKLPITPLSSLVHEQFLVVTLAVKLVQPQDYFLSVIWQVRTGSSVAN